MLLCSKLCQHNSPRPSCEAASNSKVTCDRNELNDIVPIQAMFDTGHVLFAIIPVVTLLFATIVSNMKALKPSFVRYCSG